MTALVRLEQDRLWPGAACEALAAWARFVRDPYHRLFDPDDGCGCGEPMCCPDPGEQRVLLEAIAHALPAKDARVFRRRINALDELW